MTTTPPCCRAFFAAPGVMPGGAHVAFTIPCLTGRGVGNLREPNEEFYARRPRETPGQPRRKKSS